MARYLIDETYIQKFRAQIERGEPVNIEVQDVANVAWLGVKALLSATELPGSEVVGVFNFIGGKPTGQEWHIKILEELAEEGDIPTAREPTADGKVKG